MSTLSNIDLKSKEINQCLAEIDHTRVLSEDFARLYNQSDFSDLQLIIESECFYAHRIVLAARSQYFRALLYGGMKESQENNHRIELKDCKIGAFKILLQYIYTGKISLINEKAEILLDLLTLVHQYCFEQLETNLSIYFKSILSIENVCIIYDTSCLYELHDLRQYSALFIDNHANEIINTREFLSLSPESFASIISRNSFHCPEIEIFHAVKNYHNENNYTQPIENIISKVRLELISLNDLLKIVRYSKLFDLNHILDAIELLHTETNKQINYRGKLKLNENIATRMHNAQVTEGEMKHKLLDGDVINYDLDRGYTRHLIDDTHRICVKLSGPSIINHIKLLLWDKDTRAYSYYIETSVDRQNWTRIIDYREYLCRSWQRLYFPPIVATFIRIVGTHNTVNKVFHLVNFEVYYKQELFTLIQDFFVPIENIATIESSAIVSEGVSRVRNALINGDYQSYDWDTGYTCHQIGSGGIMIQLSQPYAISSMRFLLWDCDNRSYSYYIETSCDNQIWTKIIDRQDIACRSWQTLTFSPRIIVFIRIVGTHNTANEVFHCVHFECPCQMDILKNSLNTTMDENDFNRYLFDSNLNNSSMINHENSLIQTHRILPFTIQSNSLLISNK